MLQNDNDDKPFLALAQLVVLCVIKPQIQIPCYSTTTPLILSSFFLEIAYVHMKPCLNPDLQNFVELWNVSHLKLTGTSAGPILYHWQCRHH